MTLLYLTVGRSICLMGGKIGHFNRRFGVQEQGQINPRHDRYLGSETEMESGIVEGIDMVKG